MKQNNKAFSLVELLVTIVILGVLATAAIIGVTKYMKNARIKYYTSQEKLVLTGCREYYMDNKNSLPREIGKSSKVYLSTLINNQYITEVKDYSKNSCSSKSSYATVQKVGTDKYSYDVYLDCPKDKYTKTEPTSANGDESITIVMDSSTKNKPVAKVSIYLKNKLYSYNYVVYNNGKEVKNSGNIDNKEKGTSASFNVSFAPLGDGIYTIKVKAIDQDGKEISKTSSGSVMVDTTGPKCGTIAGASTNWTNSNRTLSIACSDEVSGCKQNTYSQTFSTTTKIGKITLTDKFGNTTNCSANVYVDKTAPTCGDNNGTTSWTKNDRTIKLKCNDKGSGCKQDSYTKTFAKTTKTDTYVIIDKAGNSTNCSINVYIDKTGPKCTTSTNHSGWTNQTVTLTGTCSGEENQSGCKENITKSFNKEENGNETPGYIYDNVGNSTLCGTLPVKIDKTAPTCTTTGGNTEWTNGDVTVYGECHDTGGSECKSDYRTVAKTINYSFLGSTSPGTVYDNAGNSKICGARGVKIDKNKPSVPSSSLWYDYYGGPGRTNSSAWTNRTIYWGNYSANDTGGSGINRYEYSDNCSNNQATLGSYYSYSYATNMKFCIRSVDNANNYSDWTGYYYFNVDQVNPIISLSLGTQDTRFNTARVNYTISASDAYSGLSGKYCISTTGNCTPNTWTATTGFVDAFTSYNGSSKSIYACTSDKAGNIACTSASYKVYNNCTYTTGNGSSCDSYGGCQCPDGIQYATKTYYYKDSYTSATCNSSSTTNGCVQGCYCEPPPPPEPDPEPEPETWDCNYRGTSIHSQSYWWTGTCGDDHNTGYAHYCVSNYGNVMSYDDNSDMVEFRWYCPDAPSTDNTVDD